MKLSRHLKIWSGEADKISDADIAALALSLLANYRRTGSALKSLEASVAGDSKYRLLARLAREFRIYPLSSIEKAKITEPNLKILLNIVRIGITTGSEIAKNLEDFHGWISGKIEKDNMIRSKVNGMQILSLLGIVFFFPLFSGITASIVKSSIATAGANATINGLRLIGIAYIAITAMITNSLLKPSQKLTSVIRRSLPIIIFGCALQSVAFSLSSYAI